MREGSIDAPTRYPIEWKSEDFWDKSKLDTELARVFDVCHGCRRCVSLCDAFPTLFDLIDESETFEVDGVSREDYGNVSEQCYMCDLCYMTKCPYVPPHDFNIDFPHLMLRAKAQRFKTKGASFRDKALTSTDKLLGAASIPLIDITVNSLNSNGLFRQAMAAVFDIHKEAPLPKIHSRTLRKRTKPLDPPIKPKTVGPTTGKVALYATCFGNYNAPELGEDFFKVFQHNGIHIEIVPREKCCGMPKLEMGDLESVERLKDANIPVLAKLVDSGFDLVAPIPSCVLMYKQELPLMFPDDPDVKKVQTAFYDPFEYLWIRHKGGALDTKFTKTLGKVGYQVACHQRVQNIGLKTRDVLNLVPDSEVTTYERCSGHDGTYAVKKETRDKAVKIAMPTARKVDNQGPDRFISDCPMAGEHIAHLSDKITQAQHPMTLMRQAYGL